MDFYWLLIYSSVTGFVIIQVFLLLLQTWEHRRFARSRLRGSGKATARGRARVFVPCKGRDLGLKTNLERLLQQDYDNYEVVYIVEDRFDPAWDVIEAVRAAHPEVDSRIVVAGRARACGQKVHNLRIATEDIPESVDHLVFVDSDAQPRRQWLRCLVSRLETGETGIVTGYRWFIPRTNSLANCLLTAINGRAGFLLSTWDRYPVWGGSWGIRKELFEKAEIRRRWENTLSDDLVATCAIHENGLRVEFEPNCMVASPADGSLPWLIEFVRRQYFIARTYSPLYWNLGVVCNTIFSLHFLVSFCWIACSAATGRIPWVPVVALAVIHAINVTRGILRHSAAKTYFPEHWNRLRGTAWFDIATEPLAAICNWVGMGLSFFGRTIVWRGIEYRLSRDGKVVLLVREQPEEGLETCPRLRNTRCGRSARQRRRPVPAPVSSLLKKWVAVHFDLVSNTQSLLFNGLLGVPHGVQGVALRSPCVPVKCD